MYTLITSIQHFSGVSTQCNKARKRDKRHQTGKEEIKLSLFIGKMVVYVENPRESTKKLLELISQSFKVARYKMNNQ